MAGLRILPNNKICEQCQKPFRARPDRAHKIRFCDRDCLKAWQQQNSTAVIINCVRCGKERTIPKSKLGKVTGCGRKCRDQRITVNCERCQQPFLAHAYRKGAVRFCSMECARDRVKVVCRGCGQAKELKRSLAERTTFCSRECADNARRSDAPDNAKQCIKCEQIKPAKEFSPFKQSRDGRFPRCRQCVQSDPVNQARIRAGQMKRNAGPPRNIPAEGYFTAAQWQALCAQYDYRCVCCGLRRQLTVDHVVPLSKNGASTIANIQPLCSRCNNKKKERIIDYRPTALQANVEILLSSS